MKSNRKFLRNTPAEEAAIQRGIAADPDTRELTRAEIQRLQPLTDANGKRFRGPVKVVVESGAQWEARTRRGRPPSAKPKMHVNVRLDADIVEFFRAPGEGWQTRLNAFLAEHVKRASKPKRRSARSGRGSGAGRTGPRVESRSR